MLSQIMLWTKTVFLCLNQAVQALLLLTSITIVWQSHGVIPTTNVLKMVLMMKLLRVVSVIMSTVIRLVIAI